MAFFSSLTDDFRATSHSKPFCTSGAMVPQRIKSLCSLTYDLRVSYDFHKKKRGGATISSNCILISVAVKRTGYCAVGTDVQNAVSAECPLTLA